MDKSYQAVMARRFEVEDAAPQPDLWAGRAVRPGRPLHAADRRCDAVRPRAPARGTPRSASA